MPSYSPGKARTSQRTTTATEVRAGATTFMVMAYIIFVNPMTVVLCEGLAITILVLTRFREAMMTAVPIGLKRAIGMGIGLFIAFIGFFTSGFVVKPAAGPLPVGLGTLTGLPIVVFLVGFVLTAVLLARRVRGALLIGIVVTTVVAIVLNGVLAGWKGFATPGAAQLPHALVQAPDFSTFGRLDFGVLTR